jgi:hypothetical protein
MQSQFIQYQAELPIAEELMLVTTSDVILDSLELTETQPVLFQAGFEGCMEMYGDAETVADYLNAHEGWFCHCARPMKVESLGDNGYILTVGRFGSFGYEVEPKIAVVLHPPQGRVYPMNTIPVPNYTPPGYEVNYQAAMELVEIPGTEASPSVQKAYRKHKGDLPQVITVVKWQMNLEVAVKFPRFIHKLPLSLIRATGDRVLTEIVRQVSPRLTNKVQQDFHTRLDLPIPPKDGRQLRKIS